jgi:hypothetical protein
MECDARNSSDEIACTAKYLGVPIALWTAPIGYPTDA